MNAYLYPLLVELIVFVSIYIQNASKQDDSFFPNIVYVFLPLVLMNIVYFSCRLALGSDNKKASIILLIVNIIIVVLIPASILIYFTIHPLHFGFV